MKVVGIVGSPRRSGNTEIIVREALKVIQGEGVETDLITLCNRTVKPCDGCDSCKKTKMCHIKDDDFYPIFGKMLEADGIILASPVYFGSATSLIKALIERAGHLSYSLGRPFEGKVGGPIVVARRAGHNFAVAQLAFFFSIMGMTVPGSTYWNIVFGRRKGDVLQDEEGVRTIRNFAKNLALLCLKIR